MKQPKLRIAEPSDLQSLIDIDNESSTLFKHAGLHFEMDDDHPFVQGEALRWSRAIDQGQVYVAMNSRGASIGFAACNLVDNQPYLDQLSVALDYMRQGIGTQLLMKVIEWSAGGPLWLTTYASIPWNQPFYERYGFVVVPEPSCGPELSEILRQQRLVLPAPEDRIAMVRYAD